ncbi:WD repeat-containing and planar cell polarity effector protein fritz homolog [Paramormyrops kingsleyae]|uniref:WD repeat-containing and planar cell polarity effector protein fritz homolog n=1 Tax=Paramormyrops kingsleyae TaxID=1676925 RepID=UPI003B972FDC
MAFCLAELHLWSTRSGLNVSDTDIGTYQYYDKGEPATLLEQHYFHEKQQLAEGRGYSWTPKNQRPEKLRDSLKELEELLQSSPCVDWQWRNTRTCQLLLRSRVLVTLTLTGPQLERITIDRALVGRIPAGTISDALITERFLLLTFIEKSQVCLVQLNRRDQGSPELSRRVEKLSPSELKVFCADLPGPVGRRLARRIGLNGPQDVAVCWWPAVDQEPWLWSPIPSEGDRANLVLLSCGEAASGLKVLSCVRTEGNPLDCCFSLRQPYHILTLELAAGGGGAVLSCRFECARGHPQCLSTDRVSISAPPTCWCRDPAEDSLLLGLSDSSLVLWNARRDARLSARTPILPALMAWHPAGALVAIASPQGELQCFDATLAPVGLRLLAEDLAPPPGPSLCLSRHMKASGGLVGLQWATPRLPATPRADVTQVCDLLGLSFHGGPLGVLRFKLGALTGGQLGPAEVVQQRLRCGQVEEAIGLLGNMDWSIMGAECHRGLTGILDHLFRLELNAHTEARLEATLGMFYASSPPLSDMVILEYRDSICKYARRFFHHLLRYQRFEKAFLLAVDIGARDLFMDIHYMAQDKGELVLAEVAMKKANQIDADFATTGPGEELYLQGTGSHGRDPSVTDSVTEQPRDKAAKRKPPSTANDRSRVLPRPHCQEGVPARVTAGGRAQTGVFSGIAAGDRPRPRTNAELNPVEGEDQVTGQMGSLKIVHFGLV